MSHCPVSPGQGAASPPVEKPQPEVVLGLGRSRKVGCLSLGAPGVILGDMGAGLFSVFSNVFHSNACQDMQAFPTTARS